MTDTTPAPTEPGAPESQALSDAQWEAALKDKPLPNTPPTMLLMAQATRQALEQAAAVEEPSAQDIDRAWQSVLNKAQAQGLTSPSATPSLWQRLLAACRLPRMLAPALAFSLIAGVAVTLWRVQQPDALEPVGMKGDAVTILAADADAAAPRIVLELQALGLEPQLRPTASGAFVEVPWPAAPTAAQGQWLAERKLAAPTGGILRLLLVKQPP